MIPVIHIEDFNYELPDERIAKYPLPERDASKLLIYKDGAVSESVFRNLPDFLPEGSIMVFNDTKVVPARLFFRRATGALIEIFCLEPVDPVEYNTAFASTARCSWKCVIGNSKRWKGDILEYNIPEGGTDPHGTQAASANTSSLRSMNLRARLIDREGQTGTVEFTWEGGAPFSRVLELCGQVPIPPYLNRSTEAIDLERYQTLYAHIRGSVAAPTAGLHFTERVLEAIRAKGIDTETICLHVGAGTFLPVKSSLVSEHPMHREPFVVSRAFIGDLLKPGRKLIAVGTTSVRTLESLYYAGVGIIENGAPADVDQWVPYTMEYNYSTEESLQAIADYLDRTGLPELKVGTRIIIVPGFRFRLVDMMVTNFHQPQSTLLLLISAFVGGADALRPEENAGLATGVPARAEWHRIYDYALANGFRFLSYGDSSLLFRKR